MAVQMCARCGERFQHNLRGRPPKLCPTCRGEGNKPQDAPIRHMDKFDRPFIQNRKPGECVDCLTQGRTTYVPAGSGWAHRLYDGHGGWKVKCHEHKPEEREGGTPPQPIPQPIPQQDQQQGGTIDVESLIDQVLDRLPGMDDDLLRKLVNAELEQRLPTMLAEMGKQEIDLRIDGIKVDLPKNHHAKLPTLIQYLSLGFHVFMPGPAGSGKSTLAMQAATALQLPFGSMSIGPNTSNVKLFGYMDANGNYVTTEFRKVYECSCADETYDVNTCECGGVFLLDEMDNGHPGLLAELNQALANPYCAFGDRMVRRGSRFRMVSTGNTFGRGPDRLFVGRNILDAATLDRFWTMEVMIDEVMERALGMAYARPTDKGMVAKWILFVQELRAKVVELKLPIVVSPRSTIDGSKAIAAGIEWDQVINDRLLPSVAADTRKTLGVKA